MSTVGKSYENSGNAIIDYCSKLTVKQHPLQHELQELTLKSAERSGMLGAPEVLQFGQNFIQLTGAKNILDVGTFTGASALAWAIAAGSGAQIYTFDIDHSNYKKFGIPVIQKEKAIFEAIKPLEGPALAKLDEFIADGKAGTFDFCFIDADKVNYCNYYERAVTLLRSGGVILVDNSLWNGRVINYADDDLSTKTIDQMNKKIFEDDRTNSALINLGDGLHIAFKK